jgi:hypothetical protein
MRQAGQIKTRVAIIAAMPGELKPLTRGWQHEHSNAVHLWRWRFDEGEWVAACAGAGIQAATRAFAEVEKSGPIDQVISAGWAGALREELAPAPASGLRLRMRQMELPILKLQTSRVPGVGWSLAPRSPTPARSCVSPKPTRPPWSIWKPQPSHALRKCEVSPFIA